jgi:hypothetical protein
VKVSATIQVRLYVKGMSEEECKMVIARAVNSMNAHVKTREHVIVYMVPTKGD